MPIVELSSNSLVFAMASTPRSRLRRLLAHLRDGLSVQLRCEFVDLLVDLAVGLRTIRCPRRSPRYPVRRFRRYSWRALVFEYSLSPIVVRQTSDTSNTASSLSATSSLVLSISSMISAAIVCSSRGLGYFSCSSASVIISLVSTSAPQDGEREKLSLTTQQTYVCTHFMTCCINMKQRRRSRKDALVIPL